MSKLFASNEWDPLEEVILGSVDSAMAPVSSENVFTRDEAHPSPAPAPVHPEVLAQTAEELQAVQSALEALGVRVRRPSPLDHSREIRSPLWRAHGFSSYCPRDTLLVVGSTIIETPMVQRSRIFEHDAYRDLLVEYFREGATWLAAPTPRLQQGSFDESAEPGSRLAESEPMFDAANVVRLGADLLYLVSDSGNEMGAAWLQRALGSQVEVHACRGLYTSTHIDSTIVPLDDGLVLLNPERVTPANMPQPLDKWDKVWCPPLVDIGFHGATGYASPWIGMNLLVVRPGLVLIDDRQVELMRVLEAKGIESLPMRLTHARSLGGSFHCVTLDVRRRSGAGV